MVKTRSAKPRRPSAAGHVAAPGPQQVPFGRGSRTQGASPASGYPRKGHDPAAEQRGGSDDPGAAPAPAVLPPDALFRLTYVSRAAETNEAALRRQAKAIAARSALFNRAAGLSGALSVGDGWFAQVLEGRKSALLATFERILADPRHADIRVLDFAPIRRRRFAGWSMAYAGAVAQDFVRRAALDYAAQELQATGAAARHGRVLANAMMGRLRAP